MNGRTQKRLILLHKLWKILLKRPDGGNRHRNWVLQSQAMKLLSRKRQLPVCTNSERLLRHRRLQQHWRYSISNRLIGQRWSPLRKVRKISEQRRDTKDHRPSYHFPDCCVGMVGCSGDQLQSLCTHTHTHIQKDVNVSPQTHRSQSNNSYNIWSWSTWKGALFQDI